MENDYWFKLDKDGRIVEIHRDVELQYTLSSEKFIKHEFYVGTFRADNLGDAVEKAKHAFRING